MAWAQTPVEPLPWQDAAPLAVPFLQLPFESPETIPRGHLEVRLRAIYSNSIASVKGHDIEVQYHFETAQPSLVLRYGLLEGLELHLEAAAVSDHLAYLDPAIKSVESLLHTENKLRRVPLSREPVFLIARPGGPGESFTGPRAGLGDLWFGMKGLLWDPPERPFAVAWRAALKLPTAGRFPFGSGVVEGGTGLLASFDPNGTHFWLVADLMVPEGPVSRARLETRPHLAFQLAVGRDLGEHLTLLLQGSTHGSALRYIHLSEVDGWTFYVLAGARLALASSVSAGLGVVENLVVTERGTDIAGIFDLTWQW